MFLMHDGRQGGLVIRHPIVILEVWIAVFRIMKVGEKYMINLHTLELENQASLELTRCLLSRGWLFSREMTGMRMNGLGKKSAVDDVVSRPDSINYAK